MRVLSIILRLNFVEMKLDLSSAVGNIVGILWFINYKSIKRQRRFCVAQLDHVYIYIRAMTISCHFNNINSFRSASFQYR